MPAGRPRAFDANKALDSALKIFWKKGYEGTSMPDLTKAMGINRPSLYAAFGNKEELFRKALDRYTKQAGDIVEKTLAEPSARKAIEKYFKLMIESNTCDKNPRGCLMVGAALTCGDEAEPIKKELATRRAGTKNALQKRFEQARKEGELPKKTNVEELARFLRNRYARHFRSGQQRRIRSRTYWHR